MFEKPSNKEPQIGIDIKKEMKVMVSDAVDSIVRDQSTKYQEFLVEESEYRVRGLCYSFQKVMCKGRQPKTQTFRIQLKVFKRHPHHQKETALLPLAEAITTSSCTFLSMLLYITATSARKV